LNPGEERTVYNGGPCLAREHLTDLTA